MTETTPWSEAADRVRLDTLRRAADALGCDLVYLLVPRRRLTAVVPSEMEERLTEQILRRGGLWADPGSG